MEVGPVDVGVMGRGVAVGNSGVGKGPLAHPEVINEEKALIKNKHREIVMI